MREKLNRIQISPRFLSGLTLLLVASLVVASLGGLVSASTNRVASEGLPAETNLRVTPVSRSLSAPAPSPVPTPVPNSSPYEIAPSSSKQGKQPEVIVISNRCVEDMSQDPPSSNPRNSLKEFQLYAPDDSGIRVTNSSATDCRLTAKLSIAPDAPLGIIKLWLIDKKRIPQVVVDFAVTGITAGPIPPGLNNKGQVDVMWSVLPDQVVHDNFGAKVATEYFCIDAVIGNDSGYDIQLASIGFTVPSFSANNPNGPQYRIPNTGYRTVRGTLQRRELLNPRNMILNGIKIAGPLLTGFTPYFHNLPHKANFSELINIISNPLEKGFEMLVPDTLPAQVDRLGDQTYRDDISTRTIIPNNIQTRITTFVPKGILFPKLKGQKPQPGDLDRKNPMDVMHKLGDIVIIGEQIEHVNRIRVVSSGIAASPTDQSISGKITDSCNQGVAGVAMTLSADSGFTSRDVTTSSDGSYTFPNVPVDRTYTVTPKLANMTFNSESGNGTFSLHGAETDVNFRADYLVLALTGKVKRSDAQPIKDGEINVELTGTGLDQKKTAPVNAAGVYRFELPASDLSLLTATFQLTPKSDKYTFDGAKTWKCDKRDADFMATPSPSP